MVRDPKYILEDYFVASARLNDRQAMSRLVELRGPRLLVHATRLLGNPEEARDVVQDSWVEILNGLRGLRETRAFPAWATRIVSRRCARLIKKKQGQRALVSVIGVQTDTAVQSEGPGAAEASMVRRAINALPPPEQAATIALFYLEDMSVAEVAIALDIPVGTVKTRLMHSRIKLKELLKGKSND